MHRGSCLCGAVRFEVEGDMPESDACHCSQCRRMSGHYWASTDVHDGQLTLSGEDKVAWFQSSEKVKRGFCSVCGSTLFWKPIFKDKIAISMGAFEKPTGMRLAKHIFVADKGDYYEIADGLPQEGR